MQSPLCRRLRIAVAKEAAERLGQRFNFAASVSPVTFAVSLVPEDLRVDAITLHYGADIRRTDGTMDEKRCKALQLALDVIGTVLEGKTATCAGEPLSREPRA